MKKLVPLPEVPLGIRQACAILLASTLATGAFAAPAPQAEPVVKKAAAGESPRLSIAHDPLKCLSTEARPLVDARVLPVKEMDQGFVYFRAAGTEDFYYVLMKSRAVEDFVGELPRPMPGIRGIDYFVQALDRESLPKKTPEYAPPVTDRTVCRDERTATAVVSPSAPREGLTVGLTKAGQNPVPSGFNREDIAKVILVTGAVVSLSTALSSGTGAAAGAAATSGGLSTGAIVGIAAGAVAVGVGVAVAANNNNSNDNPNGSPTIGTTGVTPLYGSIPLQVTATATASDPDGDALTFTWNFGPGTATGATATYTYQSAGTFTVSLSVSDARGGTATNANVGSVKVDPQGTPQYLTGLASWSGDADLDVRIAGPGGIDVATQAGGRKVPAGCTAGNRTENVIYEGNRLPSGTYTLFVKHAATCTGSPATARFSYSVQATSGSKCAGLLDVAPGAEVQACTFTFP
ncbi:MAG: PKD domain-containing protein [Deltaproteobacteria bacterium]|nr:PKD domain-containing protein [Deltaproteobacteria bacterium]